MSESPPSPSENESSDLPAGLPPVERAVGPSPPAESVQAASVQSERVPTGRSFVSLLYNHNPFYVISAVLMLFAVRSVYGEQQIGAIDCWMMMGVFAGYTALLAGIGVLIVRWGKVWEDARSLFVVVLLLFLAVSVSADDLFVKMESPGGAALLLLCGYLFSAVVTELVLRGSRLAMGRLYRVPLHLMLVLFYAAPWFCASLLEENRLNELQWRILLFPVVAAGILLMLVPATRRGPAYVEDNGSPWRWPLYPWTAFGAITVAVALRTFALCMTFGPTGPIWVRLPSSGSGSRMAISYDTMWGPYFLIPLILAVLVLFFEAGMATGNRKQISRVLWFAPGLLLLALPWTSGKVHWGFLREVTEAIGSPLWLTVGLLTAFYAWAWYRGIAGTRFGVLASLSLFTFVGRETIRPQDIAEPQVWAMLAVGLILLVEGLRVRSSRICFTSCLLLAWMLWEVLPNTSLAGFRAMTTFHALWLTAIVLGLTFQDEFAGTLRAVGAMMMPTAALLVAVGPWSADVPIEWGGIYIVTLTVVSLSISQLFRSRWYLYAFTSLLAIIAYALALVGYRGVTGLLGRAATIAVGWSTAALLTAFLISAHKAGWLPKRLFPPGERGTSVPR